jgi:membrane-bound lytic murein transglycosylase D
MVKARLALLDSTIMEHRLDATVKRRIINYVENWPIASARLLARSARFFPIFEQQLATAGMPLGLKYVTVQESALRPYATSHAGAGGLWQLMPGTARELGLTVNDILDERLDPELGCVAGLEYLKIQYERYGDWALALAAYNCGPGNVNKALRRSRGRDYWSIRKHLPRETSNYLPNIIAASYVMAFHHLHDVTSAPMDLDLQVTEAITVYRKLSLYRVTQITGLRSDVVIELNAQYLAGYLPGMPGGHRLRLPSRVMPAMRTYLSLHPADQAETEANLPWTSPRLNRGELHSERFYDQFRTSPSSQDTTLRQIAANYELPVDQLAVWSNQGEFDSLEQFTELFFYRIGAYLPYDPRERKTPPAPATIANFPAIPVRIPNRHPQEWLPRVSPVSSLKEGKKAGLMDWFKGRFK